MIVKTSKLWYPNKFNDLTMALRTETGAEYTISSWSEDTYLHFEIVFPVKVDTILLRIPKDKSVAAFIAKPLLKRDDILGAENLIQYPFPSGEATISSVRFKYYRIYPNNEIAGLYIDGKASDIAPYAIYNSTSEYELLLEPGQYVMSYANAIDEHIDIYANSKFHNAMYMVNDDCDGLIWQVKHRPDNYILINGGDGGNYVPYYNKIIYPQDKYVVNQGYSEMIPDSGWARTKHYFVKGGGYAYGQDASWYGRDMTGRNIQRNRSNGPSASISTWSRTCDKGLVRVYESHSYPVAGQIYIGEVGPKQVTFKKHPFQLPANSSVIGYANGVIFYMNQNWNDLFYMNCEGGHGYTGATFDRSHANKTTLCLSDDGMIIMYGYDIHTYAGVKTCDRWAHIFDKTGKYKRSIGYWQFPSYMPENGGINTLYKFDGHFKLLVNRYDPFQSKTVFDCWDYGPNFTAPASVTYDVYRPVKAKAVGWKTRDYRNSYYGGMDQDGCVTFNVNAYWNPNSSKVLYFKDGKPTDAYGYTVWGWQPYTNRLCIAVIKGDLMTEPDEEPFLFESSTTDYLDPHNITWQRRW